MGENIFVVMGSTGEYSDRQDWPVLAFVDEQAAQSHVLKLDAWLREHRAHMDDDIRVDYRRRHELQNPDDPLMLVDYTGTRYSVMSVRMAPSSDAVREDSKVTTESATRVKASS